MPDGIYEVGLSSTAYAWPDTSLLIWGNVHAAYPPYTYQWDFGAAHRRRPGPLRIRAT